MPDGAGRFRQGFSGPALLRIPLPPVMLTRTGLSPSVAGRSRAVPLRITNRYCGPTTPTAIGRRFGLFPVRSPLLRESLLFSSPAPTEMVQFRAFAPGLSRVYGVVPFGNPRITASLQLPAAYRSFARPSSPLGAKASTMCPLVLLSFGLHMSLYSARTGRNGQSPFVCYPVNQRTVAAG